MMAQEFRVTKAPRKTLAAVTRLARSRYRKVAVLFDSFEQWLQIDQDLRSKLAGAMSEMRWKLAGDALMVFFVAPGQAPELEETFRGTDVLDWGYAELAALQENGDTFDADSVNRWLRAAALDESSAMTVADPVLAAIADACGGSFVKFAELASVAVEDAAERGVSALDQESLNAAKAQGLAE